MDILEIDSDGSLNAGIVTATNSDEHPKLIKYFNIQVILPAGTYAHVIVPASVEAKNAEDAIKKMKNYLTRELIRAGSSSTSFEIISVNQSGTYTLR